MNQIPATRREMVPGTLFSSPIFLLCRIFLLRMVRYLHPPISVFRLSQVHS